MKKVTLKELMLVVEETRQDLIYFWDFEVFFESNPKKCIKAIMSKLLSCRERIFSVTARKYYERHVQKFISFSKSNYECLREFGFSLQ